MPTTHLVWFRNDLRVEDHEPLTEAVRRGDRVLPVYCLDPRHFEPTWWDLPKTGAARARFLLEALADLRASLRELGSDLIVRRGRPEAVLPDLAERYEVAAVHVHEEVTREETDVEAAVEQALRERDVPLRRHAGHTLYHPDDLPFAPSDVPNVFTPFRKRVEQAAEVRAPLPVPSTVEPLPEGLDAGTIPSLEALGLDPLPPDPRGVLTFEGGESAALDRLDAYLWEGDHLRVYKETRNGLLGADYSSKFSPWLAHGCLSPRVIHDEVKRYERERVRNKSTYWLIFELLWRDFFRFIARKFGDRLFYAAGPMDVQVNWADDDALFERWATGTTGFPFIDANMRELNATGFMSNRGRQNVASFFSKNLNLDWRRGAAYFEATLVDYDVTSNWGNWAYVSGVGNDPRDRYFNIVKQAERYDPEAAYVKHWLPELASLPAGLAHQPNRMSAMEQAMNGVVVGEDYPAPCIDLEASYRRLRAGS